MNKELKFWLLFGLAIFAIAIAYQIVQTAANVANNTDNTLQSYAQIPGQIVQSFFNFIQNMFGGNSTGSNVTDQVNENTEAEEGLSA